MEVAHSSLGAYIYRISNVGPHFINCIVDPQNYGPNWSLYHDIERYFATEFSVFVAGLCCSMQSSVTNWSLSSFLDYFMTKFLCSNLVLAATGMPCVATPNLFAIGVSCPFASGIYRNIIFLIATNIFLFSLSTLSQLDFYESLAIFVAC